MTNTVIIPTLYGLRTMGNKVKPVRFLLAAIGYGQLHCIGHVLSPSDPCRNFGRRPGYGILQLY